VAVEVAVRNTLRHVPLQSCLGLLEQGISALTPVDAQLDNASNQS